MRIVVTGVTGQVGSAIASRFAEFGTVVAADRGALDLAMPTALPSQLEALAPDVIINPAAYTAVDRAEDERDLALTVNGEAPGVLARWAAARRVPLVHFSTDYVFDGEGERPWREDDRTSPLSSYGSSKLAGEQAIRQAGGAHLIVRSSWVYAAQGANFMRTIARLAGERPELRIVADQVGAPTTAAVIADSLAAIFRRRVDDLAAGFVAANGLVHVAAADYVSWHGFAEAIIDGLKQRGIPLKVERVLPIRTEDYPTKATRPRNSRLDIGRLREVFDVRPPGWKAALQPELDRLVEVTASG